MTEPKETVTIAVDDLDRLIEERLAKREADKAAAALAARKGATPGCNCNAEGWKDPKVHQLGCVWADPKGDLAREKVKELFG